MSSCIPSDAFIVGYLKNVFVLKKCSEVLDTRIFSLYSQKFWFLNGKRRFFVYNSNRKLFSENVDVPTFNIEQIIY